MLDIVTPHQHQPPVAVDGGRIHHGEARLAIAPTGDERAECEAAYDPDHDQQNQ